MSPKDYAKHLEEDNAALRRELAEAKDQCNQADRSAKGWMETARLADTNAQDYQAKLSAAEAGHVYWRDRAGPAEAKLAAMALDNARLRGFIERFVREYTVCPDDDAVVCPVLEDARTSMACALSSTPDTLAQEVRRYMQHMGDCNADLSEGDFTYPCTCGLDALLAKLGVRP